MAELKTKKNAASVEGFLNAVEDERKRRDSFAILDLMRKVTGEEPSMWGDAIVGFGSYHYKGVSGQEGDWPITGFSPRKQSLTLYIMTGFERYGDLLQKLGKHKTSKGCLYINKLQDVDLGVLEEIIRVSVQQMKEATGQAPTPIT